MLISSTAPVGDTSFKNKLGGNRNRKWTRYMYTLPRLNFILSFVEMNPPAASSSSFSVLSNLFSTVNFLLPGANRDIPVTDQS